ncbi:MAG: ATP-binding cassette domain-containing protein [Tissierellia bacterium]|nr:ATP-binding cassette domain-containing protein [Tissierellia bacterium]
MMLDLKNIKKSYGENNVLTDISVSINNGIHGLLGANGTGKTTLFSIISGFLKEDGGTITYPTCATKEDVLIGVLPQNFVGYPEMSVEEFLEYLSQVKGDWTKRKTRAEIAEKTQVFNLTNVRKKKLKQLSGGQLRRVGLAQAFLFNPKIVLLDEPTVGLDPKERLHLKNYLASLKENHIILLSTHIVSDLEKLADKIYILKDGKIVEQGSEEKLLAKLDHKVWEIDYENYTRGSKGILVKEYNKNGQVFLRLICEEKPSSQARPVKAELEDLYISYFQGGSSYEL